jgi:hypothetical protein
LPSVLFTRFRDHHFPIGTDFRLTILFHLMKCRPRCFNTLHSRHSNAAGQQAAVGPWHFWDNQYGKNEKWCPPFQAGFSESAPCIQDGIISFAERTKFTGIG